MMVSSLKCHNRHSRAHLGRLILILWDLLLFPLQAALPAYEERPRTKWLFENSVQNTIVVSRAFFTQEITAAFAEMEDGNENALKV